MGFEAKYGFDLHRVLKGKRQMKDGVWTKYRFDLAI